MSEEVLRRTTLELIQTSPKGRIKFVWHGGEPLMAGKKFYETAISIQQECRGQATGIVNGIQTNGTMLTNDWIDFLADNSFYVGVSIDGPRKIHDRHRYYASRVGSFEDAMRGIELLKNSDVEFTGVLAVVTQASVGHAEEIYEFLKIVHNCFDFLPYMYRNAKHQTQDNNRLHLSPANYAQFMIDVFDLWIADDNPEIDIRFFDNIIQAMVGGSPTICKLEGTCGTFVAINYNGDVYPCERFLSHRNWKLGNIMRSSIEKIMKGERAAEFRTQVLSLRPQCRECEWLFLCHGDCPYHRSNGNGMFYHTSYFCHAYKTIFGYVKQKMEEILF